MERLGVDEVGDWAGVSKHDEGVVRPEGRGGWGGREGNIGVLPGMNKDALVVGAECLR